jgi:hypothetical protein
MKTLFAFALAIATCTAFLPSKLAAQGISMPTDSCAISQAMHFKELPLPSKFVPGAVEALRNCPNLNNCVIKIAKAKVGKASHARVELWMRNGSLVRSVAVTRGEKQFEKLYAQMVKQSGQPSKMVESQGKRAYNWDLGSKWRGRTVVIYDPATEIAEAILDLPSK